MKPETKNKKWDSRNNTKKIVMKNIDVEDYIVTALDLNIVK